jgi:uncharacterized protein
MLIEFTVGNFLSIKDKQTLSLEATSITDFQESNVINEGRYKLLNGAIVYGANSSGKSNLIMAMSTMRRLITESFEKSSVKELEITPFLLNTSTEKEPSFFEILFLIDGVRYRYGFEITNTIIKAEWLFEAKKISEKPLFLRQGETIEIFPGFKEGKNLEERTRNNALFLSVLDQYNGPISKRIMAWFNNFITISGLSHEKYKVITFKMMENDVVKPLMINFYNELDLGFEGININKKKFDAKELPNGIPNRILRQMLTDLEGAFQLEINTMHTKYNKLNEIVGNVEFNIREQESAGTNKIFNISGPVFDVLKDGGVLVIDELDASLHPLMTLALTRLFESKEHNSKNAQLIFATHDTNLLTNGHYRRDQVYFIEKDKYGASHLYSLVSYKEEDGATIRKDRSFEKDYIAGRYGAIPYIGNINQFFKYGS